MARYGIIVLFIHFFMRFLIILLISLKTVIILYLEVCLGIYGISTSINKMLTKDDIKNIFFFKKINKSFLAALIEIKQMKSAFISSWNWHFWHLAERVVWGLSDNLQILEYLCNSVLYNIAADCSGIENSRQISLLCSPQSCRPTTRLSHYLTCLSVLALGHVSLPKLALTCPSKSVQWHNSANSSLCYWTTHRMLHATNHKYFDLLVVLIY